MTEAEFFSKNVFFTTREFSFTTDSELSASSRKLNRLAQNKEILKITRGVWGQPHHPYFSPYAVVPKLLGNEQGCLSFLTALHRHGMISQIPTAIQIATTGHGRVLKTPIGNFEFFQLKPYLMREGIQVFTGKQSYNLATPEKALLDSLYLSTRRGRRFSSLPELDLESIDLKILRGLLKLFPKTVQPIMDKKLLSLSS